MAFVVPRLGVSSARSGFVGTLHPSLVTVPLLLARCLCFSLVLRPAPRAPCSLLGRLLGGGFAYVGFTPWCEPLARGCTGRGGSNVPVLPRLRGVDRSCRRWQGWGLLRWTLVHGEQDVCPGQLWSSDPLRSPRAVVGSGSVCCPELLAQRRLGWLGWEDQVLAGFVAGGRMQPGVAGLGGPRPCWFCG